MLTLRAYKRIKKQALQKAPLTHLWISAQNLTTLRVLFERVPKSDSKRGRDIDYALDWLALSFSFKL